MKCPVCHELMVWNDTRRLYECDCGREFDESGEPAEEE